MKRTELENWIENIEKIPLLTRRELEALQLKRLNETLKRAKQRGGIYEGYPERLDSLEQLSELPFTTPEMLAENPGKFLLTSQSEISRVISGATSGTTGPAKRVFYTERDTENTVGFFAAGISEMLSAGEKCCIAFPFTGPFGLGDLIAGAVERLGGIPVKAGFGQSWEALCNLVRQEQPETYIGFPVTLLSLIRFYGEDFPVKRALVSADACPEGVMDELEKALGSRLYPHYGSRECGLGGAVTCRAFRGMHLRENHVIPEIVDESGNVLSDGQYGELVITTVGLEAMPLLRYRTGDYTRILPGCPCGGVTKRIDRVSRRDGAVSMETLDSVLFPIPELADYRAAFDGCLRIYASVLGALPESVIAERIRSVYPETAVQVQTLPASPADRPAYMGKRHIL